MGRSCGPDVDLLYSWSARAIHRRRSSRRRKKNKIARHGKSAPSPAPRPSVDAASCPVERPKRYDRHRVRRVVATATVCARVPDDGLLLLRAKGSGGNGSARVLAAVRARVLLRERGARTAAPVPAPVRRVRGARVAAHVRRVQRVGQLRRGRARRLLRRRPASAAAATAVRTRVQRYHRLNSYHLPRLPRRLFRTLHPVCVCVGGGNSTFSKGYVTKESTEYLVLYRFSRRGGIHFFSLGWSRPLDTTSNQGGPGWARPP